MEQCVQQRGVQVVEGDTVDRDRVGVVGLHIEGDTTAAG
jgi:hypothetical protein